MGKLLKTLKNVKEVLTTAGAVLAAAIVAVEMYEALKKKINEARGS
jgi:biopolymer transport protein ExbB/TolQ